MKHLSCAFIVDSVEFTPATIAGETSLGGSESACLGLARALRRRGHDVHIFTTKIAPEAIARDADGVAWHSFDEFFPMNTFIEWDVVVALRWFQVFGMRQVYARLRMLWNEDLLVPGAMAQGVMACAWAYDRVAYVSDYHRRQWEDQLPQLASIGWVTRNGFDDRLVPAGRTKDPNRIIHISRPERGLKPLLQMWPTLRKHHPTAELHLCRYNSMYDASGWGEVCKQFDEAVTQIHEKVGGITYLGELTKPALYQAISDAAVMWYPGVATFAETGCIAATESLACGTPFVGSLKGALIETAKPSYDAGLLIPGNAEKDQAYQEASIDAVLRLLDGCRYATREYHELQKAGRAHAKAYGYDTIAADWEAQIERWFHERYEGNKLGVMRQLLHEDDHVAAQRVASELTSSHGYSSASRGTPQQEMEKASRAEHDWTAYREALDAYAFCDKVIAGKDHEAEDYAAAALPDPLAEAEHSERFKQVVPLFDGCTRVLDVACGNGSFAIALTKANPTVHVYGLDYAAGNIERAKDGAERAGVADRCHFETCAVYDFDTQGIHENFASWASWDASTASIELFDGLFVGEFIEHVAPAPFLIDALESVLQTGARVIYTCPHGACAELVPRSMPLHRGHVHRFHYDDIQAVWGGKLDMSASYLDSGVTSRGYPIGNWIISYKTAPNRPAGERPIADRILKTRPLQKISAGIIAKNAALDLPKCLDSIWGLVDEIVVGDTGSQDDTKAVVQPFKVRTLDLPPIEETREGFAGARNAVLQATTGDWFLWIDADETLVDGHLIRRYLDGPIFNGFVIRQHHLQLDAPNHFDLPARLFRKAAPIQFYGCIHEQPQQGDCNGEIDPSLDLCDLVKIAHTGYLTDAGRRFKMLARNLPLLLQDQQVFPDRQLGKVLVIRDYVNLADYERDLAGGHMTEQAQRGYAYAIKLFRDHFSDPAHKYHTLARPFYEAALQHLGLGWEVEFALFGKPGSLNGHHAKPHRLRVLDPEEFERVMIHRMKAASNKMAPTVFKTDPFWGLPSDTPQEIEWNQSASTDAKVPA